MGKRNRNAFVASAFGAFAVYFLIDGEFWQLGIGSLVLMVLFVIKARTADLTK